MNSLLCWIVQHDCGFSVPVWDVLMPMVYIQYSNNIPIVMRMTCGFFGHVPLHMVFFNLLQYFLVW